MYRAKSLLRCSTCHKEFMYDQMVWRKDRPNHGQCYWCRMGLRGVPLVPIPKNKKVCPGCNTLLDKKAFESSKGNAYARCNKCRGVKDQLPEGMRRCTKCGDVKDFDSFYKSRGVPTGYCKECISVKDRMYPADTDTHRYCSKCETMKPFSSFKVRNDKGALTRECNECCAIRTRKHYMKRYDDLLPDGVSKDDIGNIVLNGIPFEHKECNVCSGVFHYSFFHEAPNSMNFQYGVTTTCKECTDSIKVFKKVHKQMKKRKEIEYLRSLPTKVCTKCGEEKDKSEFHNSKQTKDGKAHHCSACVTANARKKWKENPGYNKRKNKYQYDRYHSDDLYRLANKIRGRINNAMKKGYKTEEVLGISFKELHEKIKCGEDEHIDHIIPLSRFNIEDEDHVRVACNWRNLRVIHAKENVRKSDKLIKGWKEKLGEICEALDIPIEKILHGFRYGKRGV